ncbi:hypothetical protein CRUP_000065 [Coryphaenoides rupestris]|nr:hypothetical protein CRUP_000065 [Coryphaenoides rupestris]
MSISTSAILVTPRARVFFWCLQEAITMTTRGEPALYSPGGDARHCNPRRFHSWPRGGGFGFSCSQPTAGDLSVDSGPVVRQSVPTKTGPLEDGAINMADRRAVSSRLEHLFTGTLLLQKKIKSKCHV